jgi:hypothetical protein
MVPTRKGRHRWHRQSSHAGRSPARRGTPKKRRKFFLLDLYGTAVGKKYVMAITGIMLVGFVSPTWWAT